MLKEIIQELIQSLSGIQGLRYVAEDWGQLDYEQPPVQWPCALIDIQEVRCSQIGNGGLLGNCVFSIQLVHQSVHRTSSRATKPQQDQNLILFDFIDQIFLSIHAAESDKHSPFVLQDIAKVNLTDLQSYVLTFATQFKMQKPQRYVQLTGADISVR